MKAKRSRRGSVLVLVALMLVAIMGVGAIAADIGRFYVVTGEMQTAADAAALKGAGVLQFATAANPEPTVDDSVMAWVAATNRVDGKGLSVTADNVGLGFWTPGTPGTFDTNLNGRRANAVSVTVSSAPRGVFSQLIGQTTGLPLTRTGIAWIGNVSLNCVRPFNFSYAPFYRRVNGLDTNAVLPNPIPPLDPGAFAAFQKTSVANRTIIVLAKQEVAPVGLPSDGNWSAYVLPPQSQPNENNFQAQVESCSGNPIYASVDAGTGKIVPNNGTAKCNGAQVKTTCAMLQAIVTPVNGSYFNCAPFRSATDANCYSSSTASSPGVIIDMAWGTPGPGSNENFNYVAEFQLMCVFTNSPQTCAALPDPNLLYKYPTGTVVGVAQGLKSRILTPTDVISNAPSNVQRLFLVK